MYILFWCLLTYFGFHMILLLFNETFLSRKYVEINQYGSPCIKTFYCILFMCIFPCIFVFFCQSRNPSHDLALVSQPFESWPQNAIAMSHQGQGYYVIQTRKRGCETPLLRKRISHLKCVFVFYTSNVLKKCLNSS